MQIENKVFQGVSGKLTEIHRTERCEAVSSRECMNTAIEYSSFFSRQVNYLRIKLTTKSFIRQIRDKQSSGRAHFPELG